MIRFLFFLFFGQFLFAQTVSTYFSDPNASVTDAIIFDVDGNLFGSDFGFNFDGENVYKITPGGTVSTFVSGLANPNGLAFDSNGNLFVVEYGGGSIHKYDSSGALLDSFSVGSFPSGLIKDFDSDDMIFTLTSNSSVNRLSQDGTITELAQGAPLNIPVGLAFDDDGNLYTGNYVGREIHKITSTGSEFIATVPGENNASLAFIAYGNNKLWGTVFFGDNKIYSINPNEVDEVTLFAGSVSGNNDGTLDVATFDNPSGIIFNASENALYVSEFSSDGNVRKIADIPLSETDFSSEIELIISPNPVLDVLNLSGNTTEILSKATISVFDTTGRLISEINRTINDSNFNFDVNVSNLSTGFYIISIKTNQGFLINKKIIKK